MRIQHNITAMNSYRTYSNNTSRVSKNLEKLSSGYKINRAGDDAAGLAISEKMRVQITGLEQAQSNAKSGISLVQTAEGALTEVHDMLNRMYTLSEQSANGTYSNELDREQLQKEVESLRTEINRIADSTNYNGINLLDGSLETGESSTDNKLVVNELLQKDVLVTSDGREGVQTATLLGTGVNGSTSGLDHTYTFTFDKDGVEETHTVRITLASDATTAKVSVDGGDFVDDAKAGSGNDGTLASAGQLVASDTAKILQAAISGADWAKDLDMTVAVDGNNLTFTANEVGTDRPTLTSISYENTTNGTTASGSLGVAETTPALDKVPQLDLDNILISDQADVAMARSRIFEVNGRKFAVLGAGVDDAEKAALKLPDDVVTIKLTTGDDGTDATVADAKKVMEEINKIVGADVFSLQKDDDTRLTFNAKNVTQADGAGLKLQIGDTSDEFNKMTVSVKDMHAKAMGIGTIDISSQEGASAAMKDIKAAVNYVSDVRGDLGALQNRLDHTINNLSVAQENIQDAESVIRDTDVAKEMMAYTKNNILVQSAQAMLAQANQLPQGVLQLLQ